MNSRLHPRPGGVTRPLEQEVEEDDDGTEKYQEERTSHFEHQARLIAVIPSS